VPDISGLSLEIVDYTAWNYYALLNERIEEGSMEKRLYRSRNNRMLAGVCGGLANYFNVDPTVIRVITIILLLAFNIMALIAYFVLALIIPVESSVDSPPSG
jgi:phage shock protein C